MELFLESFWPMFRAGLTVSVPLMLVSFALGLVLAFIIALMRMSKLPPLFERFFGEVRKKVGHRKIHSAGNMQICADIDG